MIFATPVGIMCIYYIYKWDFVIFSYPLRFYNEHFVCTAAYWNVLRKNCQHKFPTRPVYKYDDVIISRSAPTCIDIILYNKDARFLLQFSRPISRRLQSDGYMACIYWSGVLQQLCFSGRDKRRTVKTNKIRFTSYPIVFHKALANYVHAITECPEITTTVTIGQPLPSYLLYLSEFLVYSLLWHFSYTFINLTSVLVYTVI